MFPGRPGLSFDSDGSARFSPILVQERPKRAKMVQKWAKWPKSDFELSGGPKRLEWHPGWDFGTVGSVSVWRCPKF